MTLALHFLRVQRTALAVWSLILALLTLIVAAVAPSVAAGGFNELVRSLGPALSLGLGGVIDRFPSPVDAYITIKLLYFLPAVVGVYVVLATAGVVLREQARGTLEFLLALPVDRRSLVTWRFLGVAVGTALLYAVVWLSLVGGLEAAGTAGSYSRYAAALVAAYGVNMAQGGLTLLLSVSLREHSQAVRWGLALVLGTFLFALALQIGGVREVYRQLLLYGLADPYHTVAEGRFPWAAVLTGAIGMVLGSAGGGRIMARRELQ